MLPALESARLTEFWRDFPQSLYANSLNLVTMASFNVLYFLITNFCIVRAAGVVFKLSINK